MSAKAPANLSQHADHALFVDGRKSSLPRANVSLPKMSVSLPKINFTLPSPSQKTILSKFPGAELGEVPGRSAPLLRGVAIPRGNVVSFNDPRL